MSVQGRATVLRHRDFRLLFIGQSLSQVGSQAVIVAMALYITRRTGSATDLAVILAAGSLPFVVLIVFGGVWADRLPRHRLVIASDLVRAGLHALLGVLILSGEPAIWLIAVIEALFGTAQAFFQPAYVGLIPQTVPEGEIQEAQALRSIVENASMVLGPVLATTLVLTVGAGETFLFDAASFLVGAVLLIPVHPRARSRLVAKRESFVHELRAGWREVASRSWVWGTIVAYTGVVAFGLVTWEGLGPLAVRNVYGDVGFFGVLVAVWGGGSVAGSALATFWRPRYPLRLGLVCGAVWGLVGLFVALGLPRGVVVVTTFASGSAGALTGIWWETALARHIPSASLSRVSAWDHMGSLALMPLGYAVIGPIGEALGIRWVLGAGSLIGSVMALMALLPHSARYLPAAPERPDCERGLAAPGSTPTRPPATAPGSAE